MRSDIKNIIFDYGNVIFDINFSKTQAAFEALGIEQVANFFSHSGQHPLFDNFDRGLISKADFFNGIRLAAKNYALTDSDIQDAWNSLLLGVNAPNHEVLKEVKNHYRSFLLSNNNEIHYEWILKHLKEAHGLEGLADFFEKIYLSHEVGIRKPDEAIFALILRENGLVAAETLFIDDSPQHLETARHLGIQTLLMDKPPAALRTLLIEAEIL
ncbi:MAG: HAD family phosphatase [Pedobacter sp.]|nr:MAG: HAD family phosphatase [Pedobacter sp.]